MTKKYNSEQTIENIINSASELFLEKGFEKISMIDIANNAGISKGAIYHHFKSKDEIISYVLKKQEDNMENSLKQYLETIENLNGKEKLKALLEKNLCDQNNNPFNDILSEKIKSAEYIVLCMSSYVNRGSVLISQIIQEGIKEGSIKTDFPDECAEVFLLLLNIWCDPIIFKCSNDKLIKRLKFIQHMMKSLGIDILSDEILEKINEIIKELYKNKNEKL